MLTSCLFAVTVYGERTEILDECFEGKTPISEDVKSKSQGRWYQYADSMGYTEDCVFFEYTPMEDGSGNNVYAYSLM